MDGLMEKWMDWRAKEWVLGWVGGSSTKWLPSNMMNGASEDHKLPIKHLPR